MNKFRFVMLVLLLGAGIGGVVNVYAQGEAPQQPPVPATTPVPGPAAQDLMEVAQDIVFQGKLHSSLTRSANTLFEGEVEELRVRAGQAVKKDEILLTYKLTPGVMSQLRTRVSSAELMEFEARIAQVEAEIMKARSQLAELESLAAGGFAPEKNLKVPRNAIEAMRTQLESLRKTYQLRERLKEDDIEQLKKLLGDNIGYDKVPTTVYLKSPIDGHVTTLAPGVRPGGLLPGGATTMTIGVLDPMVVRAQVYEAEALRIQTGEIAEMTLPSIPGKTFDVVLTRVNLTPTPGTIDQPTFYEVELTAPNPELLLREGLKAQIRFPR